MKMPETERFSIAVTVPVPFFFDHNSTRKQPILEGAVLFESPKCPLKSGLTNFFENIKLFVK
jgi:hypothetical protein